MVALYSRLLAKFGLDVSFGKFVQHFGISANQVHGFQVGEQVGGATPCLKVLSSPPINLVPTAAIHLQKLFETLIKEANAIV